MPFPITITLSSIVGTPGPFSLYSNVDSYVTPFETGISATGNVITSSNVPNNTTSVKIKSTGACTFELIETITLIPTNTPTPTPTATPIPPTNTPTPTPTVTPTGTPTRYYLQLQRCGDPPGTNTGWTLNSYTQAECQINDIFYSAGLNFYRVINYNLLPQGGTLEGGKNYQGYITCADTPQGEYSEPSPTYTTVYLARISGFTENQTQTALCGETLFTEPYNYSPNGEVFTKYITYEPTGMTPGTLYTLYNTSNRTPGDEFNGGNMYYGVSINEPNSKVTHTVYINSSGQLSGWNDCP